MEDNRENPEPIEKSLGQEFYMFTGGLIDGTRKFCREKDGKYFHFKEIMDWAKEDWEGKHPETNEENIFKYVGGFCAAGDINEQCTHALVPMSLILVPRDVLERNIKKGYYKPSQFDIGELRLQEFIK